MMISIPLSDLIEDVISTIWGRASATIIKEIAANRMKNNKGLSLPKILASFSKGLSVEILTAGCICFFLNRRKINNGIRRSNKSNHGFWNSKFPIIQFYGILNWVIPLELNRLPVPKV